jgi:hypothetical protein
VQENVIFALIFAHFYFGRGFIINRLARLSVTESLLPKVGDCRDIGAWLEGDSTVGKSKPVSADHAQISNRKTLADFRQTYDKTTIVPTKVKAALKLLGASGWEYEVPFARSAGVSLSDLSNFREMFADYIVTLNRENKRAWAGSPATAKQMREML